MANSWFNVSGNPTTRSPASSTTMRNDLASIAAAFDKLPNPVGGGVRGFSGGVWSAPVMQNVTISGGSVGATNNPVSVLANTILVGAGDGVAAGALPVDATTKGAFFRMATTNRVGYAQSYTGTPKTSFFFDEYRSFVMGDGANELATNTTQGFLYIPTCNGAPTGTPTVYTGAVPIIYDRANNKIYAYNSSWKATGALT